MDLLKIKQLALQNGINALGWKTKKKYVIIESDDWGTIRTPSKAVLDNLKKRNYPVEDCLFTSNDSLERDQDLIALFEVLSSVKDRNGNPAVVTANNIVANPDFEKIKKCNFESYHYELFTDTLQKYPESSNVFKLYKEGLENALFLPQFHGREHLNVNRWMKALQDNNSDIRYGFELEMFTFNYKKNLGSKDGFLDAYGVWNHEEKNILDPIIIDGLTIFKDLWGYGSETVIAPCYVWHPETEAVFSKMGVKCIQGMFVQNFANWEKQKYDRKYHFLGQKNKKIDLKYLVRNVVFEPSSNLAIDWTNKCMKEIEIAFKWNKPAIISSHRVNFIGTINQELRDKNLIQLTRLLKNIVAQWPEVEFISSSDLSKLLCAE